MSGDYHIANHTQAENDARVKILEEKAKVLRDAIRAENRVKCQRYAGAGQ
jgi:hypothetical protein